MITVYCIIRFRLKFVEDQGDEVENKVLQAASSLEDRQQNNLGDRTRLVFIYHTKSTLGT